MKHKGSIPACTGEPQTRHQPYQTFATEVYPRVYGGTDSLTVASKARLVFGLSPRVRGNRRPSHYRLMKDVVGLSPRVRGNPNRARALVKSGLQVYPRVYGGTQDWSLRSAIGIRSIPACTGEPLCQNNTLYCQRAGSSMGLSRFERTTPSRSTNWTGGVPRDRTACPQVSRVSCHVITIDPPPSSANHSWTTDHSRSRTPADSRGDVYTPGAISSMQDAKNPLMRGATSRVTTTVIGMK